MIQTVFWRNGILSPLMRGAMGLLCALVNCSGWSQSRSALAENSTAQQKVAAKKPVDLQLQIQWQSSSGARVAGSIAIDSGKLAQPRNLSLHGGSTGGIWIEQDGRTLRIHPRAQGKMGGVQLRVTGTTSSQLQLNLNSGEENSAPIRVSLETVAQEVQQFPLGKQGTVVIRRIGGDRLRVVFDQPSMIFDAGQKVQVAIQPNGAITPSINELQLLLELHRARNGGVVWTDSQVLSSDAEGMVPAAIETIPLPVEEGVYDLRVSLRVNHRFQRTQVLTSSVTQLIVLSKDAPPVESQSWRSLAKIPLTPPKESNLGWLKERLPQWRPGALDSVDHGPWASVPPKTLEWLNESAIELAPQAWYALRIKDLQIDKPHQIIVRVPSDQPVRLQATVLESDPTGALQTLQVDTATVVPRPIWPVPQEWVEHAITFWPKTKHPVLLLSNQDPQNRAIVGAVELLGGINHLPSDGATGESSAQERLAALHLEKPTLPEAFGASLALDETSGAALHDWLTFYQSAVRLTEYLRWAGYNGALVTVASDGATLYPTDKLCSTPRYDTGLYFTNGQDPIQKDVLELLLRTFDRANLRFVPVLDLGTPLIELERQLAAIEQPEGINATNSEGHRLAEQQVSLHGQSVYYNAADPRVQEEIVSVCEHVIQKYRHHPSFAGLAIQLGNHRYTQLPEAEWTADARTVDAFVRDLSGQLPKGMTPKQWVQEAGRFDFLNWRSRKLAQLYTALGQRSGSLPVYLIGGDSTESKIGNTDPNLEFGLDWELLGAQPNVRPLRFYRSRPLGTLPQMIRDASLNSISQWDRQLDGLPAAGVAINTPLEYVATQKANATGPWTEKESPPFLLAHPVFGGNNAAMRLTQSLQANDRWPLVISGWSPPRGTETATRQWLETYRALPAQRFEPVPRVPPTQEKQGTTIVRRVKTADGFYCYGINPAPWANRVHMQWHNPSAADVRWLGRPPATGTLAKENAQAILLPGGIFAVHIADPDADISAWSDGPLAEESVPQVVAERLRDLSLIAANEHSMPLVAPLLNGDFETQGDGIPGWSWSQHPATMVTRDSTSAGTGKYSLRLENKADAAGPRAWVISQPIPIPVTGRLAVTAKVKVESGTPSPNFRIAIEGRIRGKAVRQAVTIGKSESGPLPKDDWSGPAYRIEMLNLPLDGFEDLRVAFDLVGAGVVWIDDVQLSTSFINARERGTMQEEIYMAVEHLKRQNLGAAANLLTTTWARRLISIGLPIAEKPVQEKASEQSEAPVSTATRLRNWLPQVLR